MIFLEFIDNFIITNYSVENKYIHISKFIKFQIFNWMKLKIEWNFSIFHQ